MQSTNNNPANDLSPAQYNALLATAIKECRREKFFPRDHRIFLAGLILGLTVMAMVVRYV